MMEVLTLKVIPLILAGTPVSLILINFIVRTFGKYNPKLGDTTVICTPVQNTLNKDFLDVKTIYFDKYKAMLDMDNTMATIEDTDKIEKDLSVEKAHLLKEQNISFMATTTVLCPYKKTKQIEDTFIKFFNNCGFSSQKIKDSYEVIEHLPTSDEKNLSTIVVGNNETKEIHALSKGNPLKILKSCTKTLQDGRKIELSQQQLRKIRKKIKRLQESGQKVIGFAARPLPLKRFPKYTESYTENDMTFIGMIGVRKPLNRNLEESIEQIKNAQIKVYILSDLKDRDVIAIGKELGLINPQYFESISGGYLKEVPDQKLAKLLSNKEKDIVFAELDQEDKLRIIKTLQKNGETVAAVNEKRKDGFNEIITGIRKGRIVNKNTRKYSSHAITCKTAEFTAIAIALMFGAPTPLTIGMILILDITINLLLELSLRSNPVISNVMTEKYHPLGVRAPIRSITYGIILGLVVGIIYMLNLFKNGYTYGDHISPNDTFYLKAITITFVFMAIFQILSAQVLRKRKISTLAFSPLKNPYLTLTTVISIMLLYILIQFDFAKMIIPLSPISTLDWQIISFLLFIVLLITEIKKYRNRHANRISK